jgi:hypothetical protein
MLQSSKVRCTPLALASRHKFSIQLDFIQFIEHSPTNITTLIKTIGEPIKIVGTPS